MITLASKRYTLLAYGATLDSRYPEGDGTGVGAVSWSVDSGILTADTGTGSGEIAIRWDRPTTYNDASWYKDPKTFRLYVGTSAGVYDVIDGVDLSTTNQPGATHAKITGLALGVTYYASVKAINSAGVESSAATEQSFVAAAAASVPSVWDGDITGTTTISVSGDYRITADFTGTVTISANDVLLHGQNYTLTHSAGGVILGTGVQNVEVRNIVFNPTSTGRNVQVNGTLGAGCSVHHCTLTLGADTGRSIGDAAGSAQDLGGMQIYANTCYVDRESSGSTATIAYCTNFRAYGNTVTSNSTGAGSRNSFLGECSAFECWGNTYAVTGGDGNTFVSGYEVSDWYVHDNALTMTTGTDARAFIADGGQDTIFLHNAFTMSLAPTGNFRAFRVRASDARDALRCVIGYNTADLRDTSGNRFIEIGDTSSGGGAYTPKENLWYRNTLSNIATGYDPINFYGGSGFTDLTSWYNDLGGQTGTTGTGVWKMNHDTLPNGVAGTLASWEEFSCTIGGSQGSIVTVGAWTGHNPASFTPSAPSNLRAM